MKILILFYSHFIALFLLLLLFGNEARDAELRGVVMMNPPFIFNGNGPYNGFCIDLIDYIAKYVGFDYYLYLSPDGKYGGETYINGLIGEVYHGFADFAISDLIVTKERSRYVDFTIPFMSYGISALIKKSNLGPIKKFEDLTQQTRLKYGLLRHGLDYDNFNKSNNPIIRKIARYIRNNPEVNVYSRREALDKVEYSNYAFIAESTFNEYIADNNCNYTAINGFEIYKRDYAIALKKGSPYLTRFNNALKILGRTAKLNRLKHKYWRTKCLSDSAQVLSRRHFNLFLVLIFVFILSEKLLY